MQSQDIEDTQKIKGSYIFCYLNRKATLRDKNINLGNKENNSIFLKQTNVIINRMHINKMYDNVILLRVYGVLVNHGWLYYEQTCF